MMRGEKSIEKEKEHLTIQSMPHNVSTMVEAVLCLGHVEDETAKISMKINSEVYKSVSAHVQPNATIHIGQYFTVHILQ